MTGPSRSRSVPWLSCAIGCGTVTLLLAALAAVLLARGCPGEVARWRGRPEGRVFVRPAMTKEEVRRQATLPIGEHGGSGRFLDFELTSDRILFPGIAQFAIHAGSNGQVTHVSLFSANESWPDLLEKATAIEENLLAHGWKRDAAQAAVRSLTRKAREAAAGITDSGAIGGAYFVFSKGEEQLILQAGGLWSGIPWWRRANGARIFWRDMTYLPNGDGFLRPSPAQP
jgi:hypothetical protein